MRLGDRVIAMTLLEECGFAVESEWHTHAHPGEWGTVVDVFNGGGVMVRWDRSGTACDADECELAAPGAWRWLCGPNAPRPTA